jgi:hypothetical protein
MYRYLLSMVDRLTDFLGSQQPQSGLGIIESSNVASADEDPTGDHEKTSGAGADLDQPDGSAKPDETDESQTD